MQEGEQVPRKSIGMDFDQTQDTENPISQELGDQPQGGDTECFGVNILKAARYANLIIGTVLSVLGVFSLINVISNFLDAIFHPGHLIMNLYLCVFGFIIMASSFNMPCIERSFLFLMTGYGKGCFNIFVGFSLFVASAGEDAVGNHIMGYTMIITGCVFIFLVRYKGMSDEELVRSLSIMASEKG